MFQKKREKEKEACFFFFFMTQAIPSHRLQKTEIHRQGLNVIPNSQVFKNTVTTKSRDPIRSSGFLSVHMHMFKQKYW